MVDQIRQAISDRRGGKADLGTLSLAVAGLSDWLEVSEVVECDEGSPCIRVMSNRADIVIAVPHISAVRWTPPPQTLTIDDEVMHILTE